MLVTWLAKATAVLLLAMAITAALRRAPAGARYVVWLAALGALLLVPALSMWSPIPLPILPSAVSVVPPLPVEPSVASPTIVRSDAAPAPTGVSTRTPAERAPISSSQVVLV